MFKNKNNQIFYSILAILIFIISSNYVHAGLIYDGTDAGGVTNNDNFTIDFDESSTNRDLQFGNSSNYIRWNGTNFIVSHDLDLNSNQLKTARVENVSSMPGGAGGLGSGGKGRIVELTATDSTAPGCTGSPYCTAGTYSWNGTIWKPLQGNITTSNATKIITVGPTGRDYTTIAAGATYLNTLSGGEMWIDPGTYPVTTAVDLRNIRLVGTDMTLTNIDISGSGQLTVRDTEFRGLYISVNAALTAAYALNVDYNASSNSSLRFEDVNFIVNGSKVLIDSSAGTPPITIASFKNCTESAGTGTILAAIGPSNLSTSSTITVTDLVGLSPLKIIDWPVNIIGGSNVVTTGIITSIPDRTILVSPGMNIQKAVDSLGSNGGVIKLLIGTHDVTDEVVINNNNIEVNGEGPGTILRAQTGTWTGGTTSDNCVLQVGLANGTSPRSNIIIRNFKVQVGPNIHGICVNGGSEDKVMDMTIQSIDTKSTTRVGLVFTDGSVTAGSRFTASRNIITTDLAANRWVDGVHFDGNADSPPGGLYGYGNGITDSIISEMTVNEAKESSYVFSQVSASGIFSNKARNIGYTAGALGIFLNDAQDDTVINNALEGANIAGTGISVYDNVDNSIFIGNTVRGGPTNFAAGINIANSTSSGNIVDGNQFENVTTKIINSGTNTKLETNNYRATSNPTVSDDITKGFDVGTIWINTSSNAVYVSTNSSTGAAVWTAAGGGGHTQNTDTGTTANTFTLDTDDTGGNVALKFGTTNNQTVTWDSGNSRFVVSDGLAMNGNTFTLDFDDGGGDMSLQFGKTLNKKLTWDSANTRFTFNDKLYINGGLGIIETGTSPTYYTVFNGGDQSGNITYTLPTAQGAASSRLSNDGSGVLSWKTAMPSSLVFLAADTPLQWAQTTSVTEFAKPDYYWRIQSDLSGVTQARISAFIVATGAKSGSFMAVQYSTDGGSTWAYLDGSSGPSVSLVSTGLQTSSYVNLAANAKADVLLRLAGSSSANQNVTFTIVRVEMK